MRPFLVGFSFLFLVLGGCVPSDTSVSEECLPVETVSYPQALPPASEVSVFIDTSMSSTNFGKSKTASGESPFANLLLWIERVPASRSARLYGFARNIAPISVAELRDASRGVARVCAACGHNETRLDDLLAYVADQDETQLSLVLTDLWFMSTEIEGSASLAMRRSIQEIFASGRAIGILGFEAPHLSEVYDLPGAPTLPAGRIGSRPYFVMIIGGAHEVAATAQRLDREVMSETPDLQSHFALFTPNLVSQRPAATSFVPGLRALSGNSKKIAKQAHGVTKEDRALEIDRIAINKDNAIEASFDAPAGARAVGPVATAAGGWAFESAPAVGKTSLAVQAWRNPEINSSRGCQREYWMPSDFSEALFLHADSSLQLDLTSTKLPDPNSDWLLLRYEIKAVGLVDASEATQWLRDWSFSRLADTTELGVSVDLKAPPSFFPVLNLAAFVRVLQAEMEDAVEGQTIGNGQILLVKG